MPSIKKLSAYVAFKTRQLTNLDYSWSVQGQAKPTGSKRKETTMVANASVSDSKQCELCHNSHCLNQCKRFRKLSYCNRLKFAKNDAPPHPIITNECDIDNTRMCWSCLESGHFSKECSRLNSCSKPVCTAKHTTLLHPPGALLNHSDPESMN